jgi:integrase
MARGWHGIRSIGEEVVMAGKAGHRGFGRIRKLPSKRFQASYVGPDGLRHLAPSTFTTKQDAEGWLAAEGRLTSAPDWRSPAARTAATRAARMTLSDYADTWLRQRTLKPRTVALYRDLLDRRILPPLGDLRVDQITPALVRDWYSRLDASKPRQRAHAYALLRTVCTAAVSDELLAANPCRIRGGGQAKRASETEPATLEELATIVQEMPVRLRLMVLLAAWCAMRYGELAELRRSDLDLRKGMVRIRRGVVWVDGAAVIGEPKSEAGKRDVAIPPHVLPAVREHLAAMPVTGRDALLFPAATDPAKHMSSPRMFVPFSRARAAAGRPDLRFHDLRHTGAVYATMAGASLPEVMARLGHSTSAAAMRYQHAAKGRDAEIADLLSAMAEGTTR